MWHYRRRRLDYLKTWVIEGVLYIVLVSALLQGCLVEQSEPSELQAESSIVLVTQTNAEISSPTHGVTQTQPRQVTPTETATSYPSLTPQPTETPPPTPTSVPSPTSTPEPSYTARLRFVGDIVIDRYLGRAVQTGDIPYPFEAVSDYLQDADLTIGNLESAIGETGEPYPNKAYTFRAPSAGVESLALAGFDLLSLANNHALDFGVEGLLDGIEQLDRAGIKTVGAGPNRASAYEPTIFEINGLTLGFLAYANVPIEFNGFNVQSWEAKEEEGGLAWGTPETVSSGVMQLKDHVDHVIVLLHAGREYQRTPNQVQVELSEAAIDAGAAAVIGHHTHVLQPVITYGEGLIAYGLGNFAFDIDGDADSVIMGLTFDKEGITSVEFEPAVIRPGGSPRPATEDERSRIFEKLGWSDSR